MAYTVELKHKAIRHYETSDLSQKKVSSIFGIGLSTFKFWLRRKAAGNSWESRANESGRPKKVTDNGLETIKRMIETNPCMTLSELSEEYLKKHRVLVGRSVMSRALKKLNLRHKKLSISASSKETKEVKKKR